MIQANELRIGNFLRLNNPEHRPDEHGKVLKVVGVTEEYPLVQLVHDPNRIMSFGQFWHFIDPIPLDESWLRRAGFDNGWILSHNREEFNMFYTGGVYFYSADYLHHNSVAIKYVHQLQNLFFCLSGKELIFQ